MLCYIFDIRTHQLNYLPMSHIKMSSMLGYSTFKGVRSERYVEKTHTASGLSEHAIHMICGQQQTHTNFLANNSYL